MVKREVILYNGHRYRRYPNGGKTHRRYFSASPPRNGFLHRHIWEDVYGPIPDGCDIHHKDENTLNNDPTNLECLTKKEHRNKHRMQGEVLERQKLHLESIREKANAWHKTDEGKRKNSIAAKKLWEDKKTVVNLCVVCDSEFDAFFARRKFCSGACSQKFYYRRKKKCQLTLIH